MVQHALQGALLVDATRWTAEALHLSELKEHVVLYRGRTGCRIRRGLSML